MSTIEYVSVMLYDIAEIRAKHPGHAVSEF